MIVPALLTDKKEKLLDMLKLCSEFTDYAQIDIMDGEFVPSKSLGLEDLKSIRSDIGFEAHLMVKDPCAWIEVFEEIGAKKIIYHVEIDKDHLQIIRTIKAKGMGAGIALNPETKIQDFENLLNEIDVVLFMSVNPGFYGAKFIPEVLNKIGDFHKKFPHISIGIDGGIKFDNAKLAKAAGAQYICVGSAILKAQDPKTAYQKLTKLTNE